MPELSLHTGSALCARVPTKSSRSPSERLAPSKPQSGESAGNQRWSVAVSAPALPSHATWLLCHRPVHSSHSTSMFNHQHLKCSPCRQGGGSPFSIVAMPEPDGWKVGPQPFSPQLSQLVLMKHDPDSGAAPSSAPPPQHNPLQIRFGGQGSPRCCRRDLAGDFAWSAICPGTPQNACSGGTGGSFHLGRSQKQQTWPLLAEAAQRHHGLLLLLQTASKGLM